MEGKKLDEGKLKTSLLPSSALFEIARVLTYGAKKYDPHNWRKGFVWSRLMDAAMRHLLAYNSGELIDPETGISHLAHAATNLLFLVEFEKNGVGENDLWKGYPEVKELAVKVNSAEELGLAVAAAHERALTGEAAKKKGW